MIGRWLRRRRARRELEASTLSLPILLHDTVGEEGDGMIRVTTSHEELAEMFADRVTRVQTALKELGHDPAIHRHL